MKSETRRAAFATRKVAHATGESAALAARDHFLASVSATSGAVISAYRPIRTEIDPTPLMEALAEKGHRLCVPTILAPDTPLEFRQWWPGVAMENGAFGAAVPVGTEVLSPDVLIVPLLAFDANGWRLGYGGGFYDRTLELLRTEKSVSAFGYAYEAQQVDNVPREPTDQRLDAIVTENGVVRP